MFCPITKEKHTYVKSETSTKQSFSIQYLTKLLPSNSNALSLKPFPSNIPRSSHYRKHDKYRQMPYSTPLTVALLEPFQFQRKGSSVLRSCYNLKCHDSGRFLEEISRLGLEKYLGIFIRIRK